MRGKGGNRPQENESKYGHDATKKSSGHFVAAKGGDCALGNKKYSHFQQKIYIS